MRIHFYCFRKFGSNKKEHLIFNSNAGLLEYRNRQVVYYTLYSYGFSQMRMLEIYDIINVIVTVERQHKIVKILDLWISSSEWIYSSATVISSFFSILFGVTMYIPFIEINRCLRSCYCITQSVLHSNLLVIVCLLFWVYACGEGRGDGERRKRPTIVGGVSMNERKFTFVITCTRTVSLSNQQNVTRLQFIFHLLVRCMLRVFFIVGMCIAIPSLHMKSLMEV